MVTSFLSFRWRYTSHTDWLVPPHSLLNLSMVCARCLGQSTGSFSFRTWDCTAGGKRVQGFVPRRALLSRHAPHAPKLCTQVDHHDSTASAPHRGLRRDS